MIAQASLVDQLLAQREGDEPLDHPRRSSWEGLNFTYKITLLRAAIPASTAMLHFNTEFQPGGWLLAGWLKLIGWLAD